MQTVKYVFWEDDGAWLGYLQDYPDNWTQGQTLDDLKEHLRDLYADLTSGQLTGGCWISPPMKALGIDQLSIDQSILLVEEIGDSIAAEAEQRPLTDAQKQDLQRRLAAYRANPKAGSTWENVKTQLREQS